MLLIYLIQNPQILTHKSNAQLYSDWRENHEPNHLELSKQRQYTKDFHYHPLISIITPVYNPDAHILRDTIQSVTTQTYPKWELCIADGNSEAPNVREVLNDFSVHDSRIKVRVLDENLGISGNSNAALAMAEGEYIAILDHDDLLSPEMLFSVVEQLNKNPSTDIIYFDEDKISADKKRRSYPWFKPVAWSPDLLISSNFLMHSVIRRSLVLDIGGFDSEMDGAQDWDLALRATERTRKILHIPQILYHWRQVPGSASLDANAKPWAFDAQKRCIGAHLERQGNNGARVVFSGPGTIRILWPPSENMVSIIIPTKDNADLLRACLSSIFNRTSYENFEIVLVDNGSEDTKTLSYYKELTENPQVKIVQYNKPFNFHSMNNLGARTASGDILVFLNNDTQILETDWLDELAGWVERPEIGIVGAKLLRPSGEIQHAGIIIGLGGHGSHIFEGAHEYLYGPFGSTEWYRNYQAVTGACMAIRRDVFERLDGFDEAYQVGYGDIDICLRVVDAGYRVVYTPFTRLIHHEGGSRGFSQPASDVLRATVKMYSRITAGDPFFNPNLSYNFRLPQIASPKELSRESILLKILSDYNLVDFTNLDTHNPECWQFRINNLDKSTDISGRKSRILFVSHDLNRSGAPLILMKLARYLLKHGYEGTVLSPSDGPLRAEYSEMGIPVTILDSVLDDARTILDHLNEHDLLFANTILAYRTIYAARAFQIPSVWWIHESNYGQELARSRPAIAQAMNLADAIIFPSEATANRYLEYSSQDNYYPILTGIDVKLSNQRMHVRKKETKGDALRIVQVASIEPRKGQDILLRGLKKLPKDICASFECYLIGKPIYQKNEKYCREVIKTSKQLKNVRLLGEIPQNEVLSYLESADVFVFPSRDEALPISLIEAMAFGKAIIASRVGGIPEIIQDGYNGLLVDREDYKGLSQKLLTLYKNPELIQKLGQNARATYVTELTMDRFGGEIAELLDLVGQKHSS